MPLTLFFSCFSSGADVHYQTNIPPISQRALFTKVDELLPIASITLKSENPFALLGRNWSSSNIG
jgi:hypothetical protein